MKKGFKFLSVLMSLLMIMSAMAAPAFAESSEQTAEYPNTDSFFWGIDAHLGHQSYPVTDIEKQVELAAKLGVKVYSIDVPAIGDMSNIDKLVRTANAYGMDVLLSLGGESSTPEEAATFYGLVARHYATGDFGRVKYLKIMNETDNMCIAEGKDGIGADSYDSEKVAAMAARIKAANDAIKAVSGDFVTLVNYGWLHDAYLDLLRKQGADWDVTAINWYTNMQDFSSYAPNGLKTALDRLAGYDTLKDKKVIVTESNTWGGSDTLSDSLKVIMDTAYKSEMVIGMCFYELLDEPGNSASEQNFGLVRYTDENGIGEVKPVYTSIQGLIGGSDSVAKGTFTPSANYPDGITTYNKVKTYDGFISTGASSGTLDFGETVDTFAYEAVEMDIYVNSLGTDDVSFAYRMLDAKGASRIAFNESSVPVNTWVHKVIYIDAFVNYGASGRDMSNLTITGLPANTVVNITNVTFVDGISPEMKNTYYSAKELNYKMFINGTTNGGYSKKNIGEVVDITKYDYLEFDTYYTGDAETADTSTIAFDTDGKLLRVATTFKKDTWVHHTIETSKIGSYGGDKTKVTDFSIEVLNGGTYIITNMCLTSSKPVANYTHNLALDLNADHGISKSFCAWKKFGTGTTDFTKYDYLEFDFYAKNATDNHNIRIVIQCESGQARYDIQPEANTLVHYVIPVSDLRTDYGYNGDKTKCVSYSIDWNTMEDGAGYSFYNLALTNEIPIAEYEHYLGLELVNQFGNSKGYCVPAQFPNGATDFTKYDYVEFDLKASNATDGHKLRIQFKNEDGYGFYNVTPKANEWVHYVIPVNDIDCGWGFGGDRTRFDSMILEYDFMEDGASYQIANVALTANKPVAKYEHYLGLELNADHGISKSFCAWKKFGTGTTDFTKYDYLEFDFYAKNATDNHNIRIVIQCESGQAWYDIQPEANTLVHYVIPVSDLRTDYGYNGDKTKCVSYSIDWNTMEDGAGYSFYNLALTNEEEIKPSTKGDANENGKIDILDLIHMKKISADIAEYNENADINDDGMVDADDIILLRKYLLGVISSFDDIA